ncbi:MAG: hypothetical protein L0Z53_25520 [Acidobacteriales bacterium]|nr:hypothetical protein [Terriglobales bacterium]
MSTHNEHSAEHIDNPDVAHETSDVNVRGIFGFGIGLAVGTALVSLLLFGAFSVMVERFTPAPAASSSPLTRNRPVVPESKKHAESTFPEPRLQPNAAEDLAKFREQEYRRLTSYGWVDQNAGKVHIPIERAKELTLERGLPVRVPGTTPPSAPPPAPPAATTGTPAPTAAEVAGQAAAPAAQQPKSQQPTRQPRRTQQQRRQPR